MLLGRMVGVGLGGEGEVDEFNTGYHVYENEKAEAADAAASVA